MARVGRQEPTQAVVLPFDDTKGIEAVEAYEGSGRVAMDWQRLLISDIMGINSDGLWTHSIFGYEVPRQNGKGEILAMREFWGLLNGERIIQTCSGTSGFAEYCNAHESMLCKLDDDIPFEIGSALACGFMSGFGAVH